MKTTDCRRMHLGTFFDGKGQRCSDLRAVECDRCLEKKTQTQTPVSEGDAEEEDDKSHEEESDEEASDEEASDEEGSDRENVVGSSIKGRLQEHKEEESRRLARYTDGWINSRE
ncbi:hypothetical protein V8C42DRAFT_337714 [Trichoderma barbatum]